MKHYLLLLAMCFCFGCGKIEKRQSPVSDWTKLPSAADTAVLVDTPIFHIKVVAFMSDDYCIHFTNDNWKTTEDIYEMFDLTEGEQPVHVVWQTKLFNPLSGGCEGAVTFARQFKTYKLCADNNTNTFNAANRLKQYYLLNPPPERKKIAPTCNTETNIY